MTTENKKSSFAILFVDDEEKTRKYFSKAVINDFDVFTAQNVEEAKEILSKHSKNIGVVITDQRMPGGNGVVLLKHLKDHYPQIIRLLTTAYSDLGDAIEAVNKGEITRYIQKPWDFNLLKSELAQAMELFELRFQCNQLMAEKISIKNKVTKVDRAKLLLILSKNFEGINSADKSISSFIKDFALEKYNSKNNDQDFDQDFGNHDVAETLFSIDLAKKINEKIATIKTYQSSDDLTIDQVSETLSKAAKDLNLNIKIEKSDNLKIDINLSDLNLTDENNIFFAKFKNKNIESSINLLALYLLIGNFGGKFAESDNQNSVGIISKNDESRELSDEELEDLLLSVMLEN
ncbi:MAG: CheY-like chemotaxis protein [Rickettsiales bacterium]|jgi:CheY-like chemotaxis protein